MVTRLVWDIPWLMVSNCLSKMIDHLKAILKN